MKPIFIAFFVLATILSACSSTSNPSGLSYNSTSIPPAQSETRISKPDVNYTLIDKELGSSTECTLDIRLPNRISEDEIKHIAEYIYENEGADCSPLFIYYFLPDEKPGIDMAWAYSWFNPQLEVKINGMDIETEATLESSIPTADENVIGTWLDTWGLAHTIIIRKINGSYQMTTLYGDGSGETKTLGIEVVNGEERLTIPDDFFTGYMVIKNNGNLAFYDNQGFIYECQPK